jgi:hypothetical protein
MKLLLPLAGSLIALSVATSAFAAPLVVQKSSGMNLEPSSRPSAVTQIGWRHWHHDGWYRDGWHRGPRYGWGPAIGGLAAGAIVGSAIASSHAQASANAYCEQKYRSYDPASGTYLGYDGERHPCP